LEDEVKRVDFRFRRDEQPSSPPDDGLDDDERYERALREDLEADARHDADAIYGERS
jgi:hypothetical protein